MPRFMVTAGKHFARDANGQRVKFRTGDVFEESDETLDQKFQNKFLRVADDAELSEPSPLGNPREATRG